MIQELLVTANSLWKVYSDLLKTNPVIAGAVALWGMGVFTYLFKSVPSRIIAYIKGQFTVGVAIHNENMLFTYTTKWLEKGNKVFRCKSFTASLNNAASGYSKVHISVGNGNHIFFHKGRPFWLSRVEKEANNTTERKESLFISTIGWYPDSIKDFLQDVVPKPDAANNTKLHHFSSSYWCHEGDKVKRKLDSVIMTAENEKKLRAHINQYLNSKEWYKNHRIPWRTGIMLEGPPGTGKSTLALALCGEFDCHLYIASLSLMSDDKLVEMFKTLPPRSVMLIEDIDSYAIAKGRKKQKVKKKDASDDLEEGDAGSMFSSLSGLLNAIDGLCSTEDRILIATTNHIEKLDPALIRPGRFELILKIDNLNDETVRQMFAKFYPGFKIPANFKLKDGISPVQFQTMAIGNKDNPQALVDFCSQEKILNHVQKDT